MSALRIKLGVAGIVLVLASASMVACGPDKPAPCVPPPPAIVEAGKLDGGVYEAGPGEPFEADQSSEALGLSTDCARACKSFSLLKCPEAAKLPGGRTCIETCKEIAAISSFDAKCVSLATTVETVRKCPKVKCAP